MDFFGGWLATVRWAQDNRGISWIVSVLQLVKTLLEASNVFFEHFGTRLATDFVAVFAVFRSSRENLQWT